MPHLEKFAPCSHIGDTARKFVIYDFGTQNGHIHRVKRLMHVGYSLCAGPILVRGDYEHVRSLHAVQVLVVYASSYSGFAGGDFFGVERHEFAITATFQPQQCPVSLQGIGHDCRMSRISNVVYHGGL